MVFKNGISMNERSLSHIYVVARLNNTIQEIFQVESNIFYWLVILNSFYSTGLTFNCDCVP